MILLQINMGCHPLFFSRSFTNISAILHSAESILPSLNPSFLSSPIFPTHPLLPDFVDEEQKWYAVSLSSFPPLHLILSEHLYLPSTFFLPSTSETVDSLLLNAGANVHSSMCVLVTSPQGSSIFISKFLTLEQSLPLPYHSHHPTEFS